MSSLANMLAGRKRDSAVWEWFKYDEAANKSICTVTDGSSQKRCNAKLTGKNTSNLVAHLRRCHEEIRTFLKLNQHLLLL